VGNPNQVSNTNILYFQNLKIIHLVLNGLYSFTLHGSNTIISGEFQI